MKVQKIECVIDVLDFWHKYEKRFSLLSQVAKRIFVFKEQVHDLSVVFLALVIQFGIDETYLNQEK